MDILILVIILVFLFHLSTCSRLRIYLSITHLATSYCLTVVIVSSIVLLAKVLTELTKKFNAASSCSPF